MKDFFFVRAIRMIGLMFAFVLAGGAAEPINSIVSIVNHDVITVLDIEKESRYVSASDRRQQSILEDLISRKLQLQRADLLGIRLSNGVLEKRMEEIKKELKIANDKQLELFSEKQYGLNLEQFHKRVMEDMRIQILFYREVYAVTEVFEDEIQQYLMNETAMGHQWEYRLGHILIESDEDNNEALYERAASIHALIDSGEDFSNLAKIHSDGENAHNGGDLGFKTSQELPSNFIDIAQNLEIGEISEIISSSRGYHILKLIDKKGGDFREKIEQVLLSHVFFALEEGKKAQDIYLRIRNGMPFLEAVKQFSIDDISQPRKGSIGWFLKEDLPPYFENVVVEMNEGDISEPFKSPFGWHILLLVKKTSSDLNIKEIRGNAVSILKERRALAQRDVWLRRMRSNAYVRILHPDYVQ